MPDLNKKFVIFVRLNKRYCIALLAEKIALYDKM